MYYEASGNNIYNITYTDSLKKVVVRTVPPLYEVVVLAAFSRTITLTQKANLKIIFDQHKSQ